MTNEKTIQLCGKEVRLRYCAATETGFEQLAGKSIGDIDFQSQEDLIRLAVAAILAAYMRTGEEAPVKTEDLLYEAKPAEIVELFKTTIELRLAWYDIPAVVAEELKKEQSEVEEEDAPKNA